MQKKIKKPAKVPVHHAPPPNQVRIIGGQWKRSVLPVLQALGLRPTPDRVRETVFNWINHLRDGDWANAQVLDLFAGSGALGFEAASRGAASVTMVDTHTPVIRQLEENKAKLHADKVQLLRGDALLTAQGLAARGQRYDLIFLDPPYQQDFLAKVLPCARICSRKAAWSTRSRACRWSSTNTAHWTNPSGWRRGKSSVPTRRAPFIIIC